MAVDPRNLPAVGDEFAGGVVARVVASAEGLEVTVRIPLDDESAEERPVSIPNTVDPSAHVLEGEERVEEVDEAPEETEPTAEVEEE